MRYLLVARRRTHCERLAAMVPAGILQLTAEQRASVDRHMRRCDSCQGMARRLTSPEALLGSLVMLPLPRTLDHPPHLRLTAATIGAGAASIAGAPVPAGITSAPASAHVPRAPAGAGGPRSRRCCSCSSSAPAAGSSCPACSADRRRRRR